MTENEQVQEMARVLYVSREHLCIGAECEFYMYPTEEFDCRELWNAKKLYSAGYRKVERGEWIPYGMNMDGTVGNWKCSDCNKTSIKPYDFCPHCGADMRGE